MDLREYRRIDSNTMEKIYTDDDGNVTFERIYDPKEDLKRIEELRDHSKGKNMTLVASIPMEIIHHWKITKGIDWFTASEPVRRQLLNDPDNKAFRVDGRKL